MTNGKIKLTLLMIAFALLVFPGTAKATETMTYIPSETSFNVGDEVYINEFTFFYKEAKEADYYGNIKAGERVKIEGIENGYANITYAGERGYVNTQFLSKEMPTKIISNDNAQTESTYIPYPEEKIIPASHFYEKLDAAANEAIELWLTDEYDDDYIYISDGTSAYLDYFTWQRIGWMGLDDFTIIYQKNGINLFRIVISAQEGVDPEAIDYSNIPNLNLEFTYQDGLLEFPNEIGTDIYVEFYDSTIDSIETSCRTLDGITGYSCYSTNGNSKFTVSEKDLLEVSTESSMGDSLSETKSGGMHIKLLIGFCLGVIIAAAIIVSKYCKNKHKQLKNQKGARH